MSGGSEDRRSGARHGAGAGREHNRNRGQDSKKTQHSRGKPAGQHGGKNARADKAPRDRQAPHRGAQGNKTNDFGRGGDSGRPPKREGKKHVDKSRNQQHQGSRQSPRNQGVQRAEDSSKAPRDQKGRPQQRGRSEGTRPERTRREKSQPVRNRSEKTRSEKTRSEKSRPEKGQHEKPQPQKAQPEKTRSAPARTEEATTVETPAEPVLPAEIDPSELQDEVRRELRALPKQAADNIAGHLVAAGYLLDTEPQQALEHARYARKRASRIPSVREVNGIAAYNAGAWNEALNELRTARRLSGGPGHVAMMADAERAMGRPERAVELSRSKEAGELEQSESVELRIVAAGARRDLGEVEASVVSLQIPELDPQRQDPWSARLFYAYADNLLAADRVQEAFTWFVRAAHADDEEDTDAPERIDELVERLGGPDAANDIVHRVIEGDGEEHAPESGGEAASSETPTANVVDDAGENAVAGSADDPTIHAIDDSGESTDESRGRSAQ